MIEIQEKLVNENRNNYSKLFQDYKKIDSCNNIKERIKKNRYKKYAATYIGLLFIDLAIYIISYKCFFNAFSIAVSFCWFLLFVITIFIIWNNIDKLEKYNDEMIQIRDNELCELLDKYNINLQNINNVIEYFTLKLEPLNEVYKEYPILKSLSSFGTNLLFLILGIISRSIIDRINSHNKLLLYLVAIAIIIIIIILIINVYIYINRKDKYAYKIRNFIIDLKQIELLNRNILRE